MKSTTLSKSRFKLAVECPRKLTYETDARYASNKKDNEFLNALADGGHQVGALAKLLYPQGREITSGPTAQVSDTLAALAADEVVLFEPTFQNGNLLVRVDILVKRGNRVELIEVKSKSADLGEDFLTKKGIKSSWRPYIEDIAFQFMVVTAVKPDWIVTPYLLLVNSAVPCEAEGLGARIKVERRGRQVNVTIDPRLANESIPLTLLAKRDVGPLVMKVLGDELSLAGRRVPFKEFVTTVSEHLRDGVDFEPFPSAKCKQCEFYCEPSMQTPENLSGWSECMTIYTAKPQGLKRSESVFALYSDRSTEDKLGPHSISLHDLEIEPDEKPNCISSTHRHALQVAEVRKEITDRHVREDTFEEAFAAWQWPLHFIDFETCRPTLPLHRGQRPNQLLLFQFSHHVLYQDGSLKHQSQCLETTPGVIPNARVLRELKRALSEDNGTVIHWWDHERTVLTELRKEIQVSAELDRTDLVSFLDSLLAVSTAGQGRMFDLGRFVANQAFFVGTEGRSSIKKVLPAVLNQSAYLQARYGSPEYGSPSKPSLNIKTGFTWVHWDSNGVRDPYELLDPVFLDPELRQSILNAEAADDAAGAFIANGGAAMLAYTQLQRTDLPSEARAAYQTQLLRYCELDTLAMVMVYEALREWTREGAPAVAVNETERTKLQDQFRA
jgi:hypothetical protein